MSDTRCVFCGKRPEEPDESKIMLLNEKLYRCYCVTLEEYRKRGSEIVEPRVVKGEVVRMPFTKHAIDWDTCEINRTLMVSDDQFIRSLLMQQHLQHSDVPQRLVKEYDLDEPITESQAFGNDCINGNCDV